MPSKPSLRAAIDHGEFAVTAEITPRLTASAATILEQAAPLVDRVNAINVTEFAGARVTMASLPACAVLANNNQSPVLQMTCRDRNRIALAGDLLGAAALGIENVLVLTGDSPSGGDEPDAKGVFDLVSNDVLALATRMRDEGVTTSGREIATRPDVFMGTADVPMDPASGWEPSKLAAKIDAGAQFIQTQFCYQPELTQRYVAALGDAGLLDRAALLIGIGPIASARSARWMDENLFGVTVPEDVIRRLESADDPRATGMDICVELIQQYRELDGVAGVHIMAPAQSADRIAEAVEKAGI
ncbi:MAG: methylenetetrahydrofolate reductase [Pseudomonadota bacterium]